MAEKLIKYLEYMREKHGTIDKARVVMKTGFSDTKAASVPDTPDNIALMKTAIKEVIGKDAPSF
jgi:hypothetical protein